MAGARGEPFPGEGRVGTGLQTTRHPRDTPGGDSETCRAASQNPRGDGRSWASGPVLGAAAPWWKAPEQAADLTDARCQLREQVHCPETSEGGGGGGHAGIRAPA